MKAQPEQLLKQIKEGQMQIKAYQAIVDAKKELLEKYYEDGLIMSKFEIEGIKAIRRRKPEKWQYTEELNNYKKEINNAIKVAANRYHLSIPFLYIIAINARIRTIMPI